MQPIAEMFLLKILTLPICLLTITPPFPFPPGGKGFACSFPPGGRSGKGVKHTTGERNKTGLN